MSNYIKVDDLINQFKVMYNEHWSYEWGAARKGCVDCSGAFVYAYNQLNGPSIAHGSNSIFHKYCGTPIKYSDISNNKINGFAAFKVRDWKDSEKTNSWYNSQPGDVYHIGLVDETGKYVLNAKGTSSGFSKDPINKWQYVAPLNAVIYNNDTEQNIFEPFYGIVSTTNDPLNMREQPNSKSQVLVKIPKNEIIYITDIVDKWGLTSYRNYTGYVSLDYINKIAQEQPEISTNEKVTITLDVELARELYHALGFALS